MATIRQLIQTSPAKANELFAKLAETSDTAVKRREKLFSDLKEELELLARLEEEHMFPVLRKHKQTKNLVPDALNDNKLTRKLLAELERTPKESEDFAAKVVELRKIFQQHVRDEKKELLPAVLKALSDEEAQAIVDGIEEDKAEIEEAKRAEAQERRAAAREEREQVENVRQSAETLADTVRATAEAPQRVAETAREAFKDSFGAAAHMAQRAAEQFGLFSFTSADVTKTWRDAAESLTAVAQANSALGARYHEIWTEWAQLVQQAAQERTESVGRIASARTPQHLLDAQIELVRREMELFLERNARIAQLTAKAALDARRHIDEVASAAAAAANTDRGRQTRRAA
jgi:hemerythrin-like domain-containing protein